MAKSELYYFNKIFSQAKGNWWLWSIINFFFLILLYSIIALIFLRRPLFGDTTFFGCCDSSIQTFAWINKVGQAIQSGTLPLWDFSTLAGVSFAGEIQPAPFYPITWVLAFLIHDPMILPTAFIFVHFLIAALSMHALLRKLGLSFLLAVAGAIIFSFSSYITDRPQGQANIFAGQVWIPLIILFYYQSFSEEKFICRLLFAASAALVGALQIAAGHLQPFIHTCYAVGILALLQGGKHGIKGIMTTVSLMAFGQVMTVAFAAVPLELAYEYLQKVYRWYGKGMTAFPHIMPLEDYLQAEKLEWKDFHLLLSPIGKNSQDGGTLYFTITGLVCALAAIVLRPTCWIVFYGLTLAAFAILVALGGNLPWIAQLSYHLPLLAQVRSPVRAIYLYGFAATLLSVMGMKILIEWTTKWHVMIGKIIAMILFIAVSIEAWNFTARLGDPMSPSQYPPTYYFQNKTLSELIRLSNTGPLIYRYIAIPVDLLPPNAGNIFPILNVMGHRASMMQSFNKYFDWNMQSSPLDRLGVRWIVTKTPVEGFPIIYKDNDYVIQERPKALPVFWLYDTVTGDQTPASIENVHWDQNSVQLQLNKHPAGRLVFAQPFYPGWIATVDNQKVTVQEHEIFLSIEIPEDSKFITFDYAPNLTPWIIITVSAFLVFLVFLGIFIRAYQGPFLIYNKNFNN